MTQELLKKLQEAVARERLLKEQVARLEQLEAGAQNLLEDERRAGRDAESRLTKAADQADKYKRLYEEECRAHAATGQQLTELRQQHREETARLEAQVAELRNGVERLTAQHQEEVARTAREHQVCSG